MTPKEINTLATITQRVITANLHADAAKSGIESLKFSAYEGLLSPADWDALNGALKVVEDVRSRTTVRDAMEHFKSVCADIERISEIL